jgi:hypothetical protein
MTTALAERAELGLTVTPDQLDLVTRTIAAGATEAELKLYLYDCARQRVHPLDRCCTSRSAAGNTPRSRRLT